MSCDNESKPQKVRQSDCGASHVFKMLYSSVLTSDDLFRDRLNHQDVMNIILVILILMVRNKWAIVVLYPYVMAYMTERMIMGMYNHFLQQQQMSNAYRLKY